MASSVAFKLGFVLLVCMVVGAPLAQAAITCNQVSQQVYQCINYLKTGGPIPQLCCQGLRNLRGMAKTLPDRKAACRCLVATAKSIKGLRKELVSSLPNRCGVSLSYPIGPNINCDTIK